MTNGRHINGIAIPISNLTPLLSRILGRTVMDKTGLTAKYDVTLDWAPDENQPMQPAKGLPDGPNAAPAAAPPDPSAPSLFTAFQEQLGLKIESQKGPVEILVINRAEKPSEN